MHPLITADELDLITGDVRICDLRWDLNDPTQGQATYEKGHIPGAVFVDLDTDLSAPPGEAGRHPLPPADEFADTLGRLGVEPSTRVVVYDDVSGRIAARMWWMLRAIGHRAAQVLDGGYQAWVASGREVDTGSVAPPRRSYPEPKRFSGVVTHNQLAGRTVVDARAGERYRGEFEPIDPKAGHIPGAINISTSKNLDSEGRFHPPDVLADIYRDVPDDAAMACGSGVTACHDALAMVLAGRPMPNVYIGSFSEWSRLDLPVTTGPNP